LGVENAPPFSRAMPTPSCYTSRIGNAIGVADGEPYWNGYLGQVALLWVKFGGGCTSVVCDWLVAV